MSKSKTTSRYVCTECGAVTPGWLGRCPSCGTFGTITEEILETATEKPQKAARSYERPSKLSEVAAEKTVRIKSGISELDDVLGGGIVPSSFVLLGGDPGIGKSTLMTQVACTLSKNYKVLYASAEESRAQVKMRCERLKGDYSDLMVINETSLDNILDCAEGYDFLIVDSVQAVYLEELNSSAGSVSQVKECASRLMRFAKSSKTTVFVVGHVTKDGAIAGPKVLEHVTDTVLYFEGQPRDNYKLLRAVKNRFGSAQEVGVFEMREDGIRGVKDYDGIFVSDERGNEAGTIVTPTISGNRCMAVEIQTLLAKTAFGIPRRMPIGIDVNRLLLMLAVLEKRAYTPFYALDVYVNVMGGIKLSEPSADLAVALALVSGQNGIPVGKEVCAFGEIGLTGEVRGVTQADKRVAECSRLGAKTVFLPEKNRESTQKFASQIKLVYVKHVYQAIKLLFSKSDD